MKSKLIIPIIAWTLIGGLCLAVIIGFGLDTVTGVTAVILGLTLFIAAVVYVIGKHFQRLRQVDKRKFDGIVEKLAPTYLAALAIWLGVQAVIEFGIFNSRNGLELWWRVLLAIFICFGSYGAVVSSFDTKKRGYAPKNKLEERREWRLITVGCAVLAAAVVYAVWSILPTPANQGWNPALVFISKASAVLPIWLSLMLIMLIASVMRSGTEAAKVSLPDMWPVVQGHAEGSFFARGYWYGTWLATDRKWAFPIPVLGRGYWWKCSGELRLEQEAIVFRPKNGELALIIPFGLIHEANLVVIRSVIKAPQLVMRIIWGRPELAMMSQMRLQLSHDSQNHWAQEIMRRAGVWKEKMASIQADVEQ